MRAAVIERWTGREARALREAKRMTVRGFAAYLGVSERTISKWEAAREDLSPRPEMQAALDTALARASEDERTRLLATVGPAVFNAGITLEATLPLGEGTTIVAESDPPAVVLRAGHWQVTLVAQSGVLETGALETLTDLLDGLLTMRDKLRAGPAPRRPRRSRTGQRHARAAAQTRSNDSM